MDPRGVKLPVKLGLFLYLEKLCSGKVFVSVDAMLRQDDGERSVVFILQ